MSRSKNQGGEQEKKEKESAKKFIPLPPLVTGDMFGEISVLTNLRRTCTVET